MISRTFIAIILFLLFAGMSQGQELLVSVSENPDLKGVKPITKSGNALLQLPFIEDFSGKGPYPNTVRWSDAHAFINHSFAPNSPGFGVATLDAIDSTGALYAHANTTSFVADYLTSAPINLDFGADTSIYLSFYYQPQGLGDAPEERDSLVLEFYAPEMNKWIWMWSVAGSPNQEFQMVLVPVRGAIFMQEGFRFRFKNYASLADAYEPSLKVNADHWHLDYIYLNNNRHYQDYNVNDLTLQRGTGSLLLNYTAIPWQHFKLAGINEVSTIFPIHVKNLSSSRKFFEPVIRIIDEYGSTQGYTKELIPDEAQAFQELNYDASFNFGFGSDAPDSALFTIELDLRPTEQDLIPENTTLSYHQVFKDYYAYDDGSAENGYGLVGDGTANGIIAVRFKNFNPGDSLIGISAFFNRSFQDANQKYFQVLVMDQVENQPGDILYRQAGVRANNDQGLTGFEFFPFDSAQTVPGTFFIGIQQVTNDFLNLGFDANNNNRQHIFYRTLVDWKNTAFEGSLMIRPVFANKSKKSGTNGLQSTTQTPEVILYPNPAENFLHITLPNDLNPVRIRILDLTGRECLRLNKDNRQIDTSGLMSGTYFLIVDHPTGIVSKKFIKI